MSQRSDNRKDPRFSVQIDAEIHLEQQRLKGTTKDMSRGGICLVCSEIIASSTKINLSLALMLGANSFTEKLELPGRVIWCTPLAQGYQVGVAFVDMTPERTSYLDMFLRFLQQEILLTGHEAPGPEGSGPQDAFDTGEPDKT